MSAQPCVLVTPERIDRLREIYVDTVQSTDGSWTYRPRLMRVGDVFPVLAECIGEDCIPESWLMPESSLSP